MSRTIKLAIVVATLLASAAQAKGAIILSDDFDPGVQPGAWANLTNAAALGNAQPGFLSGNALWFNGNGQRSATTVPLNVSSGGTISFAFRGGNELFNGETWWEDSEDSFEWADLWYSVDGVNFVLLQELSTTQDRLENPTGWNPYSIAIPLAAQSSTTQFRFVQRSHSGDGYDHWAIDNLQVDAVAEVPEPASLAIWGLASLGLAYGARRARQQRRTE